MWLTINLKECLCENNLQNIEAKVKEWSREVDELKTELQKFRNDEGHTKTGLSNVLFLFPYFWNRHRLGRQAKKMAERVKNLIDESAKFNEVSYTDNFFFISKHNIIY